MQTTSWHSLRSARVRLCHSFCALPSAIVQPRASMTNHELERAQRQEVYILQLSLIRPNYLGGTYIYVQIRGYDPTGLCLATRRGSCCDIDQSCLARPI